jgi:hypothetical protein
LQGLPGLIFPGDIRQLEPLEFSAWFVHELDSKLFRLLTGRDFATRFSEIDVSERRVTMRNRENDNCSSNHREYAWLLFSLLWPFIRLFIMLSPSLSLSLSFAVLSVCLSLSLSLSQMLGTRRMRGEGTGEVGSGQGMGNSQALCGTTWPHHLCIATIAGSIGTHIAIENSFPIVLADPSVIQTHT